jgi:hypothetical protein
MPRQQTYYGPSLVAGQIRYLSVTQFEQFDRDTEGGCKRKFWFRRVARIPEPQRKPQKLGEQVHSQIEHYLKTGQDVLGEVARAGKRFLPRPGSDLLVEHEFSGFEDGRAATDATYGPVRGRIVSALQAGGIPVIGYIDLMHARGEWVDDAGASHTEPQTAEVLDHKTSKQIADVVDDDTGIVFKKGWAKSAEQLACTWQMSGYGVVALARWPGLVGVRLSHGYYQTQGPRAASKRSVLVSVEDVVSRWRRSDQVVEEMRAVARVTKVEDVEPNLDACSAYGGCAYRSQCPMDPMVMLQRVGGKEPAREGRKMASILDQMRAKAKGAALPAANPAAAAVAAEKAKLLAEEKAGRTGSIVPPDAPAPQKTHEPIPAEAPPEVRKFAQATAPAYGDCSKCYATLNAGNASRLPNGTVQHIGCVGVPNGGQMVSIPTSEIRGTEDGRTVGGGGPPSAMKEASACIPPGQRELTADEAIEKKIECPCGETLKIKKPQKMDGKWFALVPSHVAPAAPAVAPAPAPAKEGTQMKISVEQADGSMKVITPGTTAAPTVLPVATGTAATAILGEWPAPTAVGIDLYLDCVPDGVAVQRLDTYAEGLAEAICREAHAADLRCAPKDSALSYGGWKGMLAATAKAQLPPPGAYVVSSSNEIAFCVFEAIAGKAKALGGKVVRGVGR